MRSRAATSLEFPESLLGVPWVEGGRDCRPLVGGADCLGIVLAGLRALGYKVRDPWDEIEERWKLGRNQVEAWMPTDWRLVDKDREDVHVGDVLILNHGQHCVLVVPGQRVLGGREKSGSYLAQLRHVLPFAQGAWRLRA